MLCTCHTTCRILRLTGKLLGDESPNEVSFKCCIVVSTFNSSMLPPQSHELAGIRLRLLPLRLRVSRVVRNVVQVTCR